MRTAPLSAALLMACLSAGCVHGAFTKAAAIEVPSRAPTCGLDVVFEGPPPHPYVVLGDIWANWTAPGLFALGNGDVITMRRTTEQACAMGAHGLMNVVVIDRRSLGRGHWRSTAVTTVAFVYVDESGRPLPAPNRTRILTDHF